MKRTTKYVLSLMLVCLLAALLLPAQEKEEKKKEKKQREEYMAVALVTSGGAAGSTMQLTILIDSFTPDDEILRLAQTLKDQGPDALAKAMDKTRRGRISPVGRVGNDINVARTFQTEKGRIIRLALNRPMGFLELRHAGRSTDYEFSVIELLVDAKGKGQGMAVPAAKLKFNKENQLEIEQYGQDAVRIVNVQRF